MLSTIAAYFGLILAVIACFGAYRAVYFSLQTRRDFPTPSRLAQIDAEIAELTDSVGALSATMKRLAGRQAMRDHRARKANGDGTPDPREDPDGYKRAMRLKYGIHSGAKTE